MTVGSKVKQTMVTLKWIESTLRIYSSISDNIEQQEVFEKSLKTTSDVIGDLQYRIKQLELEEPQYKGL